MCALSGLRSTQRSFTAWPCLPLPCLVDLVVVSCCVAQLSAVRVGEKNPLWNDHRQQVSLNLNSNKQSTGAYDLYYHKKIGYLI